MTQPATSRFLNAVHWLTASLMVASSALFAGVFLASGILSEKPGLVICALGWALITVPIYYHQHPTKQLTRGSVLAGLVGGIIFFLGLAVHAGAL
jgi:hypothetical protein